MYGIVSHVYYSFKYFLLGLVTGAITVVKMEVPNLEETNLVATIQGLGMVARNSVEEGVVNSEAVEVVTVPRKTLQVVRT